MAAIFQMAVGTSLHPLQQSVAGMQADTHVCSCRVTQPPETEGEEKQISFTKKAQLRRQLERLERGNMSSTRLVIRNDLLPSLVKPIIKTEYFPTPAAFNVCKTSIIYVFCSLQKLQDNCFSNFHLTENQSTVSCICSLKIFHEASKSKEFEKLNFIPQ